MTRKHGKNYKVFRDAMADGLKVVYQDKDWIIGVPETYESSAHFKRPVTDWCTAYPDEYEEYMARYGGKYYIHLNKHTGELYQLHAESNQFKDANDDEIDKDEFIEKNPQLKAFYGKVIDPSLPELWCLHNNMPSEEELIGMIHSNPALMQYIPNPSEELQLAVVSENGYVVSDIQNPSKEVRLAALKQNGEAIMFISKPTKEERLIAVKSNPLAIIYISNPTEEEQLEAVSGKGLSIQHIRNPSEAVQLKAIEENPYSIECIDNPTEEMKKIALKYDANCIKYIKNQPKK